MQSYAQPADQLSSIALHSFVETLAHKCLLIGIPVTLILRQDHLDYNQYVELCGIYRNTKFKSYQFTSLHANVQVS